MCVQAKALSADDVEKLILQLHEVEVSYHCTLRKRRNQPE